MIQTKHCKLIAKKEGLYTIFVFQESSNQLIMCTKLPNWGSYLIQIGDTGFLTYEEAIAGQEYYDRDSDQKKTYQFTNIYFKDFIKDNIENKQIIL